jgi:hypothetical protein
MAAFSAEEVHGPANPVRNYFEQVLSSDLTLLPGQNKEWSLSRCLSLFLQG